MPASGLRHAHLQALRSAGSAPNSAGNSRSGSPDPSLVSRQDWLRHQEKLIKDVDPSFDASLICPISLSSSPATSSPPPSSTFPTSLGLQDNNNNSSSHSSPPWLRQTSSDASRRGTTPGGSNLRGPGSGPFSLVGMEQGSEMGGSSTGFSGSSGPSRRRMSLDSSMGGSSGTFREVQRASKDMDMEGTFIESISIIPVDDESGCSNDDVLFEIVSSDGRKF